jgi:hypothetical protein
MKSLPVFLCAALLALAACSQERTASTRGIGVYPGNPDESFAPSLVKGDGKTYRNLALERITYQSSCYDYNLTSQLVTDGIIGQGPLPYVDVSYGSGQENAKVARELHERLFDGKPDSRIEFRVPDPTVEISFHGMSVETDRIEIMGAGGVRGEVTVYGSRDGESWEELGWDPVTGQWEFSCEVDLDEPAEYSCFKMDFDIKGAPGLSLNTVNFYKEGELIDVLPSTRFVSAWRSASSTDEWVTVDLGFESVFDKLVFHWLNPAVSGEILVSDDNVVWTSVAEVSSAADFGEVKLAKEAKARYVRAWFNASADGEPFELAEFEVFGRGGAAAVPKAAPARQGARQDLVGGAWKLRRASLVQADGAALSGPSYDDGAWMSATVPGTVLASFVNAGAVADPAFADNQFLGSDSYFRSPFWYRDTFDAHIDTERQFLHFDGINWKADVYLNGISLGRIEGAFREGEFDVTGILKEGRNDLAVLIHENIHYGAVKEQTAYSSDQNGGIVGADNPTMHATVGWDWIPTVRGRDIGIWDDVYIAYKGAVGIADPFVRTVLPLPDTTSADVFAEVTLVNHSTRAVSGSLRGAFGDEPFELAQSLAPGEARTVQVPAIHLEHPKLWWPKGYGEQNLYDVCFVFVEDGKVSDDVSFKSGVRQMDYSIDGYDPTDGLQRGGFESQGPPERLSLFVNGRRFIGFGGNWGFPEMLLNYRGREYDIAVRYHADMNFTIIRNWVGMTGDKEFYEACDRHGIMVWQDFWLANPWDGPDPYYPGLFEEVSEEYIRRIRNHPSLAIYVGRNEGNPPAEIDAFLADAVAREHPGMHYIPHSAAGVVSGGGPYRALPPKDYFSLWGHDTFHSERGMPNVMNYEDMKRAFGQVEPVNTMEHPNPIYGLHDYTLGVAQDASSAQSADSFNGIIAKAFGEPADAKEFADLAQWVNYDGYRAIFEARSEQRRGMILWMSHPAWPSMVWQTYDYYFEPTAAYFGSKKACEPLHILWNPLHDDIEVVNYHAGDRQGLSASCQIVDISGDIVWSREAPLDIREDQTVVCFPLELPSGLTEVYFIKLKLTDASGAVLSDNFYWRGLEEGNLKALRTVAEVSPKCKVRHTATDTEHCFEVMVRNDGPVPALMLRLKAMDSGTDDLVLPVLYSDNYFFLMPGDSRTVTVKVRKEDCAGKPYIRLSGFNVKEKTI